MSKRFFISLCLLFFCQIPMIRAGESKLPLSSTQLLIDLFNRFQREGRLKENSNMEITVKQKNQIATDYKIINRPTEYSDDIHIGLIVGSHVDIPGLGMSHTKNERLLHLDRNGWYWEIGACSTNKRVFVNALTGEPGVVHHYPYCTKVNELTREEDSRINTNL
jgi:hypothetical protein